LDTLAKLFQAVRSTVDLSVDNDYPTTY